MRTLLAALGLFLLLHVNSYCQVRDPNLAKKVTVNGFCLCTTTLSSLKQLDAALKEVHVEEMDLCKGPGQDSRYIDGKGYTIEKQTGIIFQKDRRNDFISKIRLTKQFKGILPNGKFVDMSTLTLKDVFELYPDFINKGHSRPCSDYWSFSNDTISFYVKIDNSKPRRFLDYKDYYMSKPIDGIDLWLSCYSVQQDNENPIVLSDKDPIYFLDSVKVNKRALYKYNENDIATVTVYKDTNAIKRLGPEAKNGLIYIETKIFDKKRYWKYFNSKSPEYAKAVLVPGAEFDVQYILNNKILKKDYEGDLAAITDGTFKSIRIISRKDLKKEYGISDKEYGVVITCDMPVK